MPPRHRLRGAARFLRPDIAYNDGDGSHCVSETGQANDDQDLVIAPTALLLDGQRIKPVLLVQRALPLNSLAAVAVAA